jgi:hypothetical protein
MTSPYKGMPERQFWKLAVKDYDINTVSNIYRKRFPIRDLHIATAGSCFAQEIAKHLRKNGYTVIDKEPAPPGNAIRSEFSNNYGYGLYSARHGNIYTARQLLQLTKEAFNIDSIDPEVYVWEHEGRYYDALRPNVEPTGLDTPEEVIDQRRDHVRRFKSVLEECGLFIFTLGLTEAWIHKETGTVYPTAPGTIAGQYDPLIHEFRNFTFKEVYNDFNEFRSIVLARNPSVKLLITVSPVPLTATYENAHVLVSTVRSKSVLRTVAAQLYDDYPDIDYFPSYELFSTPFLGKPMFKENKRTVHPDGVATVMKLFLNEHKPECENNDAVSKKEIQMNLNQIIDNSKEMDDDDAICEEALLEAFAEDKK